MLVIILAILFLIYLLTLFTRSGKKLNVTATKIIRVFLFILGPVLIGIIVARRFNIYPRGYWFTKGIFWIVVVLIMILFGLGNRSSLSKIEKIIYKIIFYLPFGFIPLLLIPFVGIGIGLLFYVSFIGDKSFIVYSDTNIRIERKGIRFMGPDPPLEIYVKDGLLSHKDTVLPIYYNVEKDSLSVRILNDSTYFLTHYLPTNSAFPNRFEEFTFRMRSK